MLPRFYSDPSTGCIHGTPGAIIRCVTVARILLLVIVLAMACGAEEIEPTPAASTEGMPATYGVPVRTAAQLAGDLAVTCANAVEAGQPMLLEFSAPWCSDCQLLHRMKRDGALATELSRWPTLVINVGHFDLHTELLAAFGVKLIAHWAVLEPSDCDAAPASWSRLAERTLEPNTGAEQGLSPADLAAWLASFRAL
jgi:thiol:disulfide interchange protein